MMNFNAAAREVCIVRTETTNTPLQALTLMNNKVFIESSRWLAQRMILQAGNAPEQAIRRGYRLTVGRLPNSEELDIMRQTYVSFLRQYRESPSEARKLLATGTTQRDQTIPPAQHAAMTMIATILLNLDETVSKE